MQKNILIIILTIEHVQLCISARQILLLSFSRFETLLPINNCYVLATVKFFPLVVNVRILQCKKFRIVSTVQVLLWYYLLTVATLYLLLSLTFRYQ